MDIRIRGAARHRHAAGPRHRGLPAHLQGPPLTNNPYMNIIDYSEYHLYYIIQNTVVCYIINMINVIHVSLFICMLV